jgi:hypothetical protein
MAWREGVAKGIGGSVAAIIIMKIINNKSVNGMAKAINGAHQ